MKWDILDQGHVNDTESRMWLSSNYPIIFAATSRWQTVIGYGFRSKHDVDMIQLYPFAV